MAGKRAINFIGLALSVLAIAAAVAGIKSVLEMAGLAGGIEANIIVESKGEIGYLPRPWLGLAQGGEELPTFLDGLEEEIRVLGLKYIRIDHIYDQFGVVNRVNGQLVFDWTKLDLAVEKIRSVGATPLLALSYMPPVIATGDVITPPKNWSEWSLVVQKTVEHYSRDRAIGDIYYEVWNEPDLFGDWTPDSYVTLYRAAAQGAVRVTGAKKFKIGGPATTGLYKNWVDRLLEAAEKEKLRLDFVSWHRYDTDIERHIADISEVESWIADRPYFQDLEVLVSEWGPYSENNAAYDGLPSAAHLLALVRRQMGRINLAMTFSIKDGPDTAGKTYWGRWGLFTSDKTGNKPKPRYTALRWLTDLGQERLALSGEGTWVSGIATKKEGKIQLLLTNYDISGKHNETVPVKVTGLEDGNYSWNEKLMSGSQRKINVTATGGVINQQVYLKPNDSVFIEVFK